MSSPTQRTLKLLRDEGWVACVVEKWIPQTKRRLDVFGFGDILAFNVATVALVQCTSGSNHANRANKILASPEARAWVAGLGRSIMVISWRKAKTRRDGKYWQDRVQHIEVEDFPNAYECQAEYGKEVDDG